MQYTADRNNFWRFIHFYYSRIMRTFSRSFYCLLIHIQSFFNDYDVPVSKIIHPITFRNYAKHQIKMLWKKNVLIKEPFYKTSPPTPSEYFWKHLIKETFLRYKTNILCLPFNHVKESVSSKKCSQVIKEDCERNLVKRETKN